MNPGQPKSEQPNLSLPELSLETPKPESIPARPEMDYQIPKMRGQPSADNSGATASPLAVVSSTVSDGSSIKPVPKDPALSHLPHVADDLDLMEKEWMVKAKHLLAKNHKNPHEQVREISLVKAAYLKRRFNKEFKITDG